MTKYLKIICILLAATIFCAQFSVAEDITQNQENNSEQMLKIDNFRVIDGSFLKTTINGEDVVIELDNVDCELWRKRKEICLDKERFITFEQLNFIAEFSRLVLADILNEYRGKIRFYPTDTIKPAGEEIALMTGVLYAGGINVNTYMTKRGKCRTRKTDKEKYDTLPITLTPSPFFNAVGRIMSKDELDECVRRSF